MKRINLRFVLILLIGLIVSAGGMAWLWRIQVSRNAHNLLGRADEAREQGEYAEAIRLRKRYLNYQADDDSQLCELAFDCLAVTATDEFNRLDLEAAYATTEMALRKVSDNHKLRRKTVDFLMQIGRFSDAIEHLGFLKNDPTEGAAQEIAIKTARCLALTGDRNAATSELHSMLGFDEDSGLFDPAKTSSPEAVDAFLLLAAIYETEGLEEPVLELLNQAIEANPDSHTVILRRARIYWRTKEDDQREKARQDIKQALALAPDKEQVILAAAQFAIADRDFKSAEEHLAHGIEVHPTSVAMYVKRSDLARQTQGISEAQDWILRGLKEQPGDLALIFKRTELELLTSDINVAKDSIDELRRAGARRDWIGYLEARLLMKEKKWVRAAKELEGIKPTFLNKNPHLETQLYVSLARCYEQLAQWDLVIQAAKQVPDTSEAKFAAIMMKAHAFNQKGQVDQSIHNYQLVFNAMKQHAEDIDPHISFTLYTLHIAREKERPVDQRDFSKAKEILTHIRGDEKISRPQKVAAIVELFIAQRKLDKAYNTLDKALKHFPDDPILVQQHLRMAGILNKKVDTNAFVKSPARHRLLQGEKIIESGGRDVKAELSKLEQDIDDWTASQKQLFLKGLASQYLSVQLYDDAHRIWRTIAELDPNNLQIRSRMFELAYELNDEIRMNESLSLIEELVGKSGNEWKLAEAMRLIWMATQEPVNLATLEDASRLLREIEEIRPDWSSLLRTQARVSLFQNDQESALEYLERALENGQNDLGLVQQLADIYLKMNRPNDARRVLEELPVAKQSTIVRRWVLQLQKSQVSIKDIDEIVPEESDSPRDLIWRATLLARHKHQKEAEHSFRRVTQLKPRLPDGWVSLVDFLLDTGRRDLASDAMRAAQIQLSQSFVHITLARCQEIAASKGSPSAKERGLCLQKAEDFYRQAIENNPGQLSLLQSFASFYLNSGQDFDATVYLDEILKDVESHQDNTPPTIAWARRAKASIMSSSGSFQDYLSALEEIRKNVPLGAKLDSRDLRTLASITLSRTDVFSQKSVIQEFEDLQALRRLTVDEQMLLARLYQQVGRNNDSEQLLYSLLVKNNDNQNVISLLIETLLKQNKLAEAGRLTNKLPQNSPKRLRIQALLLAQTDQADQARNLLLRLVPPQLPHEQDELLRNVATLLEEIGQVESAEKIWKRYVNRVPSNILLFAAFLGRCEGIENLRKAFDICDQIVSSEKKDDRIGVITQIGVASLRKHMMELDGDGKKDEYIRIVNGWFDIGLQNIPDSKTLLMQKAELDTLRGKTDSIIQLYQHILRLPDLTPLERALVQNNLAYIFALEKKGDEALELVAKAMRHLGPTAPMLDTQAMAKIAIGRYVDARHDLNRALDEGETAPLRFHLAYVEFMDHNKDAAKDQFRHALQLGLNPHVMHPVERKIYEQLIMDLGLESLALNVSY